MKLTDSQKRKLSGYKNCIEMLHICYDEIAFVRLRELDPEVYGAT